MKPKEERFSLPLKLGLADGIVGEMSPSRDSSCFTLLLLVLLLMFVSAGASILLLRALGYDAKYSVTDKGSNQESEVIVNCTS